MKKGIFIAACGSTIAGFILIFRENIFSFIMETLDVSIQIMSWIWALIFSTHVVPGILILILGIFAVFGFACICIVIYAAVQSKVAPEFVKYKEDSMFGAKWRWSWDENEISNLWCFCPKCDAQLVHSEFIGETKFLCERCPPEESISSYGSPLKVVATIRGGDRYYAISAVKREIWRRIRTNSHTS